jgi:Uma2 family endonuclease
MVTQTRMSLADFLALPEAKPYREFVRGEVVAKSMPNDFHSDLVAELVFCFKAFERDHGVVRVGTELRHLSRAEDRVYIPDVSLTLRDRLPGERQNPVEVVPDMIVEVLSPDDRAGDVLDKVDFYLRIGVRLIWLIDPEGRAVTTYRPGEAPHVVRPPASLDATPILPDFTLPLEDLFNALPEDASPE